MTTETQTYVLSSRVTTKITTETKRPLFGEYGYTKQEFSDGDLVDVEESNDSDDDGYVDLDASLDSRTNLQPG